MLVVLAPTANGALQRQEVGLGSKRDDMDVVWGPWTGYPDGYPPQLRARFAGAARDVLGVLS